MLTLSDFDFDLPTDLIASHPLPQRDASRMLVVVPANEKLSSVGGVPRSGEVVRACEVGANTDEFSNHPGTSCHPSNGGEQLSSCSEQKFPSMEGCPTGGVVNIYDKHIRYFLDYLQPGSCGVFYEALAK